VAKLAAAIKEFGWTVPVLVDAEGTIVAGHGRIMAARKLKLQEVPTIELRHLTEAQRRAYVIADNRLALDAGWDEDLLRVELADLTGVGFDLGLIGFSQEELDQMLLDVQEAVLPELSAEDKPPIQQMSFLLHDEQAEVVREALERAKALGEFLDTGNENSNGNALARVCEIFLGVKHGR
jgi:ParB-like chromosome segregation protein Spo0J